MKRKIKISRKCDKCNGWGKERFSSIYCTRGLVIDCNRCGGTGNQDYC